jgi:hypothetical protein
MTISMYQASVPAFLHMLTSMAAVLDKAEAHAAARKVDPAVLLGYRLAPDMLPLTRQIQIMADFAKGCAARLAGIEPPKYADDETTIAGLKARLEKTASFLEGLEQDDIDGSEDRDVTITVGSTPMTFKGQRYLIQFVLPNFYFHATTAYDILRHCGVELGKKDFMGQR